MFSTTSVGFISSTGASVGVSSSNSSSGSAVPNSVSSVFSITSGSIGLPFSSNSSVVPVLPTFSSTGGSSAGFNFSSILPLAIPNDLASDIKFLSLSVFLLINYFKSTLSVISISFTNPLA